MPVGFRFQPTDEELVGHYLKHKLMGDNSLVEIIAEVDVCKHEPWDLPGISLLIWPLLNKYKNIATLALIMHNNNHNCIYIVTRFFILIKHTAF